MKSYSMLALALFSANSLALECTVDFKVANQWNDGFTADVTIINEQADLTEWTVNWTLPSGRSIRQFWNTDITESSGVITAKNLSYNANVPNKGSIKFGYTASFSNGNVDVNPPSNIQLNGALCELTGSSNGTGNDGGTGTGGSGGTGDNGATSSSGYSINKNQSHITFVTTKKVVTTEVNRFDNVDASIDNDGNVSVSIKLDSVNTNNTVRDENIKQYLFETNTFPTAEITAKLDKNIIDSIGVGSSQQLQLPISLALHGVTSLLDATVLVQRLSETKLVVGTLKPLIINADDYGLAPGIDMLKTLVNLSSISLAVPIDAQLVFEKNQ